VLILACLPAWASSSTCSDSNAAVSSNLTSILKTTNTTDPPPSSSEPQPSTSLSFPQPLQGVYIVSPHPFPEVEAFVTTSATDYPLDLARYALPMRPALEAYLGEKTAVKAIFVGTRRTSTLQVPNALRSHRQRLASVIRVHPVIGWHYEEIWAVSLFYLCPFCFVF
jgi:FAD synthetase